MHRGAICWEKANPDVLALLLVLLLGPIISNNLGWQMTSGAARAAERAAIVEQALYEASDPDGVPWAKRGRIVREAWLDAARLKLATPDNSSKT